MRGVGCRIRWNLALGRELYDLGWRFRDIAPLVGAPSESALVGAAKRYWPPRQKPVADHSRQRKDYTPKGEVIRRCPNCWTPYSCEADDNAPHCFAPSRSLYQGVS